MKPRPNSQTFDHAGFTLIEVLLVAAIGMIVASVAIPNFTTAIGNMRLRASMSSLSGMLQDCRMMAVQQNKNKSAHFTSSTEGLLEYVKDATDATSVQTADPQVVLQAPISALTTPSGTGAPSAISAATLGFTPQTGDPSFNSRGMPCSYSSGTCTNYGFIYYFKDNRISGVTGGWAAISITPAGRIKRWFWNGSSWS